MKIAVIICTYQRPNNKSKEYLNKMFKMLENQTYQDFKVFIIGDCYEDNNEFEELCKNYQGDIYYYNSPIHFRKNYFTIEMNKWSSGGSNSRFIGIKKALDEKYDYYFHLDDDDLWSPNHIENAVTYIKQFPLVDFMICKSNYENIILPREAHKIKTKNYNNFIISQCNSVHSSWIINLNTLGVFLTEKFTYRLNIINEIKNKKIKEYELNPFDASLLINLKNLQKIGKIKAICILERTVTKESDCNIPI